MGFEVIDMRITKKPILFYLIGIGQKISKIRLPRLRFREGKNGIKLPGIKGGYKLYLGILILGLITIFAVFRLLPLNKMQSRFSLSGGVFEGKENQTATEAGGEPEEEVSKTTDNEFSGAQGEKINVKISNNGEDGKGEKFQSASKQNPVQTKEKLLAPIEGKANLSFGIQYNSVFRDWRWHPGLDYQLAEGEPIKSALSGKVVKIIDHEYYGWLVIIEHGNGIQTRYAHCKKLNLVEGKLVKQGEIIGEVGMTGLAEVPHLHWEVWLKGEAVDPEKYLGKRI